MNMIQQKQRTIYGRCTDIHVVFSASHTNKRILFSWKVLALLFLTYPYFICFLDFLRTMSFSHLGVNFILFIWFVFGVFFFCTYTSTNYFFVKSFFFFLETFFLFDNKKKDPKIFVYHFWGVKQLFFLLLSGSVREREEQALSLQQ